MSIITEKITKKQWEVTPIRMFYRSTTSGLCNSTVIVIHAACLSGLIYFKYDVWFLSVSL